MNKDRCGPLVSREATERRQSSTGGSEGGEGIALCMRWVVTSQC